MLRPASTEDLPRLRDIERAAGEAFREVGMAAVADDEPPSIELLLGYVRAGRAWVATDPAGVPAGYLIVDVFDGTAHVEQVSVHPDHRGQRLGRALLDEAATWAARHGLSTLTLTTFTDVPWNAPYYERLGFRVLVPGEGLRRIREHEAQLGLDRWPRVAMARPVTAAAVRSLRTRATDSGSPLLGRTPPA